MGVFWSNGIIYSSTMSTSDGGRSFVFNKSLAFYDLQFENLWHRTLWCCVRAHLVFLPGSYPQPRLHHSAKASPWTRPERNSLAHSSAHHGSVMYCVRLTQSEHGKDFTETRIMALIKAGSVFYRARVHSFPPFVTIPSLHTLLLHSVKHVHVILYI